MIATRASFVLRALAALACLHAAAIVLKADTELERGKKFLEQNGTKRGIRTTPSGLEYEVLEDGVGRYPRAGDTVVVNYRGTLINGKEFDSSYKRKEPLEISLTSVIKGWAEGLQLMKEGAKYRLFIPADLAYGSHGFGSAIGPDQALIFEVNLIQVK